MPMTKDEVAAEHLHALGRMDEDQVRAIKRIARAHRESSFSNRSVKETMELVFEEEAIERSKTEEA